MHEEFSCINPNNRMQGVELFGISDIVLDFLDFIENLIFIGG